MKAKYILLTLALASIGFTSCKKCITCTYPSSGSRPASSEDFCAMKSADRDLVTKNYKDNGGSCVDK